MAKPEPQEVQVSFWTNGRGKRRISRRIGVRAWSEIVDNYPGATADSVTSLVRERFEDEHGGRLVLWHGAPGTGKTHALRALAWEWRKWCSFHYITDPEEFFGSPKYMLDVLLDETTTIRAGAS